MQIKRRKPLRLVSEFTPSLHPVLAQIYAQRLMDTPDQVEHRLAQLAPAQALLGLSAAVERLAAAVANQQRILIVGDFDADGATSTAVCIRLLRGMGAQHVDYLVPNRFDYGYGLTPELVAVAQADYKPALMVTVDNGISSIAGVAAAQQAGIDVIVTDHHLPGDVLPEAYAIVNPNCPGDDFPSKHLAGVGVAFYVLAALYSELKARDVGANLSIKPADVLDLVALGTVADVVRLDHNNRILVAQGLARIRAGRCVPGITALLQVAGRDQAKLAASDLAFAVAPRLNAAGRLEDISVGIECLLTDDSGRALQLARELDELNRQRRDIQAEMQLEAQQLVAKQMQINPDQAEQQYGMTVYQPGWHVGVVGLVAGKLKEQWHRPVVAFAEEQPGLLKGSARSIPGFHIRDALADIDSQHPGLLSKFGGHAMAAGLSLPIANLAAFSAAFDQLAQTRLAPEQLQRVVYTDGELPLEHMTLDAATLLRQAGPWGQGFPEPLFDGEFTVERSRIVGEKHIKLTLSRHKQRHDAIWFFAPEDHLLSLPAVKSHWQVAYKLDVNEYLGSSSLQLIVETMLSPSAGVPE